MANGDRKRAAGLSEVVLMRNIQMPDTNTMVGESKGPGYTLDRKATYYVLLRNIERLLRQCEEENVTIDSIVVKPELTIELVNGAYRITVEGTEGINLL